MIMTILFNVLAFILFIFIFAKFIRKNDTSYIYILALQFLGIAIDFICLFFKIKIPIFLNFIIWLFSVVIPISIIILEKKNIDFGEMLSLIIVQRQIASKPHHAKKRLLTIIEKYPNSYYAHKMLAKIYEENKENEKAIEELTRVIEIKEKDWETYLKISKLLKIEKQEDKAIKVLNETLRRNPEYYKASLLLGDILYDKQMFKEAIIVYENAIKLHPEQYDLYYNLAMAYTRTNDFQKAKEYYQKAAIINSRADIAKLSLGQIALIFDEVDEAEKYFMECTHSESEKVQSEAYYYLAQISMIQGQKDKALLYLNMAVEINPKLKNRAEKENLFAPIIGKMNQPITKEKQIDKFSEKEEEISEHLAHTYSVVEGLNNHDLTMMQNVKKIEDKERDI